MRERVIVKWSKKENDWISKYPEWKNRNAKIAGNAFFTMIDQFEKLMRTNWEGKPTGFVNLRQYLIDGGFDPDTFVISVKAQTQPETHPQQQLESTP